jgi:putative acetyltransferase
MPSKPFCAAPSVERPCSRAVAADASGDEMKVHVRSETASDVGATYSVVESAFGDRLEAELVNALRRSAEPQLSLVAEAGDAVVGHIFFSPITIEADRPAPPACQLSPVAVLPEYQRRGIGGELIRAGLSRCRAVGWSAVFLVGNPAYYSRFGFRMAGPWGFAYPGPHDPFLQLLELDAGALSGLGGRIRLHPAFAEVGAE